MEVVIVCGFWDHAASIRFSWNTWSECLFLGFLYHAVRKPKSQGENMCRCAGQHSRLNPSFGTSQHRCHTCEWRLFQVSLQVFKSSPAKAVSQDKTPYIMEQGPITVPDPHSLRVKYSCLCAKFWSGGSCKIENRTAYDQFWTKGYKW